MPDAPGPGWWLASDGNWYPPAQPATPVQPPLPGQPVVPVPPVQTDLTGGFGVDVPTISPATIGALSARPSPWIRICLAIVVLLAVCGVGLALLTGKAGPSFTTGTPAGEGFLCSVSSQRIFVTWTTVGGRVTGDIKASKTSNTNFAGTQTGNTVRFSQNKSRTTLTAVITGQSMALTIEGNLTVHCNLTTTATATAELPKSAGRTQSPRGGVIATQSNLTNAVITAKTIYQKAGGYPTTVTALAVTFTKEDPAIKVTGGTPTPGMSVISAAIGGTTKTPNPNVVIMSAVDSHGGCWIVADNESTRATVADPSSAIPSGNSYAWEKSVNGNCAAYVVKVSIPSAAWSTSSFSALHHTKT